MSSQAIRYLQHENVRLKTEIQAQQEQIKNLTHYVDALADLYKESQRIMKEEDPLDALDQLLLEIVQVCGSKDGSVLALDRDTHELVFTLVHGELRQQLPGHRIKSDVGVAGWAIENGQNVIVNNPHQDWRFSLSVDQEFAFLTRSILCVPIHCGKKIMGVTELINKDPSGFTDADLVILTVFAHIAAMVLAETDDCPIDEMPDESDNIVTQLL